MRSDGTMVEFNPFMAGTDDDPYPTYAWLRDEDPVYHSERHGFYAVSRFADVEAVSRAWQRFSNAQGIDIDQTGDLFGPNFITSDPPDHRLTRRLLQHRFSPRAISDAIEPLVRDQVNELVAKVAGNNAVDVGRELAWPLPFSIACHLLGFPSEDREFLWDASQRFEERQVGRSVAPEVAERAAAELRLYVAEQAAGRRRNPGHDLVTLLVSAEIDGKPLTEPEIVGNTFVLFNAGTQTTACLLTNALVLLGSHPEQLAWLTRNPDRVPDAVEEFLRFEAPVQHFTRTTTEEVSMHGIRIPHGSKVVLLYGAANRDPREWIDPERLDLSREPKRHVAFGEGIHFCLGAPIARLEGRIALEALLPHLRNYRLTDPPTRLRSHQLRGYVSVPAALA